MKMIVLYFILCMSSFLFSQSTPFHISLPADNPYFHCPSTRQSSFNEFVVVTFLHNGKIVVAQVNRLYHAPCESAGLTFFPTKSVHYFITLSMGH